MTAPRFTEEEREEAARRLQMLLPKGSTVRTIVRHVSQSGMSRAISVLAVDGDEITDVSWLVQKVTSFRLHPSRPGLKVTGCGMDMAFHVVYTLAQEIYGDGYALSARAL